MKLIDRKNKKVIHKRTNLFIILLYTTITGRILLKMLTKPVVSNIQAKYMNSKMSKPLYKMFVKKNKINLNEYEKDNFKSYNDFFTRKIKDKCRPIRMEENILISPCDSKVKVYNITENTTFKIKNSTYSLNDLIPNKNLNKYKNGIALIFRLEIKDYHHYCYIDSGNKNRNTYIKGVLHTVQPISRRYKVYKRNCREYTTLNTNNFGNVIQLEIGALGVGRIVNLHERYKYYKGEEKGYFEFGGSTIVLLFEQNKVVIDKDIIRNTNNKCETIVKMGEKIGRKL